MKSANIELRYPNNLMKIIGKNFVIIYLKWRINCDKDFK